MRGGGRYVTFVNTNPFSYLIKNSQKIHDYCCYYFYTKKGLLDTKNSLRTAVLNTTIPNPHHHPTFSNSLVSQKVQYPCSTDLCDTHAYKPYPQTVEKSTFKQYLTHESSILEGVKNFRWVTPTLHHQGKSIPFKLPVVLILVVRFQNAHAYSSVLRHYGL